LPLKLHRVFMTLNTFLDYLKYEKRFSPHTIEAYRNDLEQLTDFVRNNHSVSEPKEIRLGHLRSWMVHLLEEGCVPRTVHRKISAVKSWFRFLRRRGAVSANPAARLVLPKVGKRLPAVIQESEMRQLFERVQWGTDFEGVRDRLVLELLYQAGLRRSELIGLKLGDIDTARRTIKVIGKGDKSRIIPFGEQLFVQIDVYLSKREASLNDIWTESLFVGREGKALTEKQVYTMVRRYLGMVTTQEYRSPHVLRHAFATHLSNRGAELTAVKALLGHSSLAATQVYMHNSAERLRQVYLQAHPKAGVKQVDNNIYSS
jgi:integrase/recombinase XerC